MAFEPIIAAARHVRGTPYGGDRSGSKFAVMAVILGLMGLGDGMAQDASTTNAPAPGLAATVSNLLAESSQDLAAGDYESAIRDASTAIQLDPQNASAYELRGSIYIEQKLWDRAERDYTSASKLSPDVVYKYKLGEIRFLAKQYDEAKPRFVALEGDERLGDLCKYKGFLCDLLGDHDDFARHDLAALDQSGHTPAYYFSHGAWALYHANRAEAGKYFTAAGQLYDRSVSDLYLASLLESRRFILATVTFIARDGTAFDNASVFLENDGLRASTPKGWVTLPLDQLPENLAPFPEELREQIARKRAVAPDGLAPASVISFTTRSGRTYDQVRWSVIDSGLSVLTKNGWIVVPFQELPEDRSTFPADLQQAIKEKQALPLLTADRTESISFTTVHGKTYTEAKAFLLEDGLRVLTAQGWITVPFRELPKDLSVFPTDWREQIRDRRSAAMEDPFAMQTISFTTRKGARYDEVRAALGGSGLRLVTAQGWVEVPFKDLPADVSSFPEPWRETIAAKETAVGVGKVTPP